MLPLLPKSQSALYLLSMKQAEKELKGVETNPGLSHRHPRRDGVHERHVRGAQDSSSQKWGYVRAQHP